MLKIAIVGLLWSALLPGHGVELGAAPAPSLDERLCAASSAEPGIGRAGGVQPLGRDFEDCLDRISPQMCANCCFYVRGDCEDACDDDDSDCYWDCQWDYNDCVDTCFGID